MESTSDLTYDTLKRLTKVKTLEDNVTNETVYSYDALNNVNKIESIKNDTLINYTEISYENNRVSTETHYFLDKSNGVFRKSTIDKYVYEGNILKRVNSYSVSSGNETLGGFIDYEFDASGNVKKATRQYISFGNPKIESISEYTYTNVISTLELNWIISDGIPYLQNKTLPASIKYSYYNDGSPDEVESMNFTWSNLNSKGFAQSVTTGGSSGDNITGSLTYKCD
ncbi:MAG: hypothetical protein EAY81_10450 [Bacteroidetes bacterium]|nr:MAG: hypothetical protein EAY81_10450 [Bacteroidota bacterium]